MLTASRQTHSGCAANAELRSRPLGLRTQLSETDLVSPLARDAIYAEQGIGQRTPHRTEAEESAVARLYEPHSRKTLSSAAGEGRKRQPATNIKGRAKIPKRDVFRQRSRTQNYAARGTNPKTEDNPPSRKTVKNPSAGQDT